MNVSRNGRRAVLALLALPAVAGLAATLAGGLRPDQNQAGAEPTGPATRTRDEPAPPLTGRSLQGQPFDLTDLRGRVVLVNVWASWCAPCRQELPLLGAAARRWSESGLRLVGVDVRDQDSQARVLLGQVDAAAMTVVADPAGTTAVAWGVTGVPETFLVDRAGRVRLWVQGAVTAEWLEQRIPPLLSS